MTNFRIPNDELGDAFPSSFAIRISSLFYSACLSLFAALLLGVIGCGGIGKGGGAKDVLIYAQSDDPKTLDPINTDIAEAVHVITNVFDTLVTYDDTTTDLVPSLAESWKTSEDGLAWTFKLRPGVLFHDGRPCNAAAVKLTFERLLVPLEVEESPAEDPPAGGKPPKTSKPPKETKSPGALHSKAKASTISNCAINKGQGR